MRKNITIFNFKSLPKAFLIAILLIALTEISLYLMRPELVTIFWNKFIINENKLLETDKNYDYLIVGDSLQKTGINPSLIGGNILNTGLPGSKPMGLYLILERYLKKHNPPEVIFLFVDPDDIQQSMHVILKYYVTVPEFVFLWKDLTWDEKLNFFLRYWVSFDERIVDVPERGLYLKGNAEFVKEMKKNQGFMPSPNSNNVIEEDYFAKTGARKQDSISITKRDIKYLDKFMKLASSKNIKIVFLGNLLPKELNLVLDQTGFNRDYLILLEVLEKKYPEASFPKRPIMYLDNKYFGDRTHLNYRGVKIYTEYFKKEILKQGSI